MKSLELAPATKTKLRNIMSAVYSHGIRHEWITFNPISKVRCSAKRLREPDVLTPGEFQALLRELPLRERAMVMIAGSHGPSPVRVVRTQMERCQFLHYGDCSHSVVRA